jgi:cobalamin biosynthesis Mg chelatase CobN
MMFALAFCGAAAAHPGHGTAYPEEVTSDQTSDQSTDSGTTGTGSTTNTASKKSTASGASSTNTGKSVQLGISSNNAGTDDSGDQSADDTSEPIKVANTTSDSNTFDTNATSKNSNNSPWNTAAITVFLVAGLGAVGLFLKGSLFK